MPFGICPETGYFVLRQRKHTRKWGSHGSYTKETHHNDSQDQFCDG